MIEEQFQGRAPDVTGAMAHLLRKPRSHQFHYLHHPLQWDVSAGVLVPRMRRFELDPGVSGVVYMAGRADGNGLAAIAERKGDGWIEIPREPVEAWGKQQPDYCLRHDGYRGQVHAPAWLRFSVVGITVNEEHDDEGWRRWLQSLVDRKIIPPCSESVRKGLALNFRDAKERRHNNDKSAGAQRRGDEYEVKLAALSASAAPPPPVAPLAASPAPALASALDGIQSLLLQLAQGQVALSARLDAQDAILAAKEEKPKKDVAKKETPPKTDAGGAS